MISKTYKLGLGVVLAATILAGCSSNSNTEQPAVPAAPENTNTTTTTPAPAPVSPTVQAPIAPETVFYFDYDQASLRPDVRAALATHAALLKEAPRNIRLEGHADERGTREYNMALGERRAKAVRDYLVLEGVSPSLIEVISYGEEQPASLGQNDSSWQLNRRTELK